MMIWIRHIAKLKMITFGSLYCLNVKNNQSAICLNTFHLQSFNYIDIYSRCTYVDYYHDYLTSKSLAYRLGPINLKEST